MAELEITLTHGGKNHHLTIDAGDADAAAEAKDRISFIIDVHVASGEPKKRATPKPPTPTAAPSPTAKTPADTATERTSGGAK